MLSNAIPFPPYMIFHFHILEPNTIAGVCLFDLLALICVCISCFCYGNDFLSSNGNIRHLRELFQVDPADYMLAICGNDALRELSSPGKSGSFFYLTQDDRFMIKTVKKSEVKVSCLLH